MGCQEGQLTWTLVKTYIMVDISVWCSIGNRKGICNCKCGLPIRTMVCYVGVFICCEGLLGFRKVVWIEGLHCTWYLKLGNGAVRSVKGFLLLYDLVEDIGMWHL